MSSYAKPFSLEQYQLLLRESKVLEQDRHGIKVLCTAQGRIVKLFRRKSVWSSAWFKPYAVRFIDHAARLRELGVETVDILDLHYCQALQRHLVFYEPVPGQTLRATLVVSKDLFWLMELFARFLSKLHHKGILFRSVHFGNVIVLPDSRGYGLIDIADMQIKNRALTAAERARNFRHMSRYAVDIKALADFGPDRFLQTYLEASGLKVAERLAFLRKLTQTAPFFNTTMELP